jgi:hypothetical protein
MLLLGDKAQRWVPVVEQWVQVAVDRFRLIAVFPLYKTIIIFAVRTDSGGPDMLQAAPAFELGHLMNSPLSTPFMGKGSALRVCSMRSLTRHKYRERTRSPKLLALQSPRRVSTKRGQVGKGKIMREAYRQTFI